jgi:hypothetical protein
MTTHSRNVGQRRDDIPLDSLVVPVVPVGISDSKKRQVPKKTLTPQNSFFAPTGAAPCHGSIPSTATSGAD